MDNNELMNNEVIGAVEEVAEKTGTNSGLIFAAGVGVGIFTDVICRYAIKPIFRKIKAAVARKEVTKDATIIIESTPLDDDEEED